MITVKGRELMIPPMERNIGTTYDESAEVRIFRIDRVTAGGIDLSHLNFRLDLEYQGEKKDSSLLAVEVREDSILLTWTIRHSCVATAGTVWIAIRGYDDNGTVKWATNKGAVYAKDTIDTPGSNPPGLTELEQLERRIDEKTETLDAHEGERQQNEVIRQENEQKRQNNEAGWQRQAETAIGQANTTLQGANAAMEAAQGSATSAAESAAAANASKEAAAGSASAAEESAAEAQRISQGFAGFDGTAESVPAVDVQGLVVQAGSASNVQALLNYLAVKVAQELVSNEALTNKLLDYMLKSSIVQTESTDPTTVPSSPYFKQVTDKLTSDLVVDRGAVTGDFNNYRSPGIYRFNGEPSILNSPGSVAGNLEVIVTTGYVIQRITVYDRTHTRRYNGSVWTDWASYVTGADIQSGIATVNAAANGTTEFTVNFPKPFSKYPEVVMSAVASRPDLRSAAPLSRDTQKVTGVVYNGTSASELSVFWIAIAK